MSRLLSLYPRAWRDRYGAEMLALLESRPPTPGDRLDIARGAIDARLHPELAPGEASARPYVAIRRLGVATIAVAPLWVLTWWLAMTGPVVRDEYGTYVDGSAARLPLIVAMGLLTLALAVHTVRLPGRAALGRTGGTIAATTLMLWAMGPWVWPLAVVGVLGIVLFAVGAWHVGAWSGAAAATLAGAATSLLISLSAITVASAAGASDGLVVLAGLAIGLGAVAWLVVGAMHLGAVETIPVDPGPTGVARVA